MAPCPSPPGETPGPPTDSRRTAILQAVWQVVATRGIAGVSVRSVATAAGVSPGLVQHHFSTKEQLVRAGARHMIDGAAAAYDAGAAGRAPREQLRDLLVHALPRARDAKAGTGAFYSFVAAGVADPHIARTLADAKRGAREEVTRLLTVVEPATPNAGPDARRLLALADGLALAVFLGALPVDEAVSIVDAELERVAPSGTLDIVRRGRTRTHDDSITDDDILGYGPDGLPT